MKLCKAIEKIRFQTSTIHDLSGRSANERFTNRHVIFALQSAMEEYASKTRAIEDIYSVYVESGTPHITAPSRALRSRAYRWIEVWENSMRYTVSIADINKINSEYTTRSFDGITRFVLPWKNILQMHPIQASSGNSTALDGAITATDTTITLADGTGFLANNGRITIGTEKISYETRSNNTLSGCTRGEEDTTAVSHLDETAVYENNFWIYYKRLPRTILMTDNNRIESAESERELLIAEEHMHCICNRATWQLLIKTDPTIAQQYNFEWEKWLNDIKGQVAAGYGDQTKTGNIRPGYAYEGLSGYYGGEI